MRLFGILALLLVVWPALAGGREKAAKNRNSGTYAVIGGSVFRDTGAALPGAEITLVTSERPGRPKKVTATSDSRGEFAFRVPAGQGSYTVSVRAKGYQDQEKPVATAGEDRIDVFFRLDPASK